jgi:hypothetical protein
MSLRKHLPRRLPTSSRVAKTSREIINARFDWETAESEQQSLIIAMAASQYA